MQHNVSRKSSKQSMNESINLDIMLPVDRLERRRCYRCYTMFYIHICTWMLHIVVSQSGWNGIKGQSIVPTGRDLITVDSISLCHRAYRRQQKNRNYCCHHDVPVCFSISYHHDTEDEVSPPGSRSTVASGCFATNWTTG
jgi:hypothetical protein